MKNHLYLATGYWHGWADGGGGWGEDKPGRSKNLPKDATEKLLLYAKTSRKEMGNEGSFQ